MDKEAKEQITVEIYNALANVANKKTMLSGIQPTTSVLEAAAKAAVAVIEAFEIGYQLGE